MWVLQTQACTTDVTNSPQTCLRDNLQAAPAFLHILWIKSIIQEFDLSRVNV